MGLRSRLKRIIKEFSGEYSSAAPEQTTPYSRPGIPDDGAEVVMARLTRANSLSAKAKKKDAASASPEAPPAPESGSDSSDS